MFVGLGVSPGIDPQQYCQSKSENIRTRKHPPVHRFILDLSRILSERTSGTVALRPPGRLATSIGTDKFREETPPCRRQTGRSANFFTSRFAFGSRRNRTADAPPNPERLCAAAEEDRSVYETDPPDKNPLLLVGRKDRKIFQAHIFLDAPLPPSLPFPPMHGLVLPVIDIIALPIARLKPASWTNAGGMWESSWQS